MSREFAENEPPSSTYGMTRKEFLELMGVASLSTFMAPVMAFAKESPEKYKEEFFERVRKLQEELYRVALFKNDGKFVDRECYPVEYVLQRGDSLEKIAETLWGFEPFHMPMQYLVDRIVEENGIEDKGKIWAGQKIIIPLETIDWNERVKTQGLATYYGDPNGKDSFYGRPTAGGEPMDTYALTAANRDLPLGSIIRVTTEKGGEQIAVEVTINDRGPYHKKKDGSLDDGRILDCSFRTAETLGLINAGSAPIEIKFLGVDRDYKERVAREAAEYREENNIADMPVKE